MVRETKENIRKHKMRLVIMAFAIMLAGCASTSVSDYQVLRRRSKRNSACFTAAAFLVHQARGLRQEEYVAATTYPV